MLSAAKQFSSAASTPQPAEHTLATHVHAIVDRDAVTGHSETSRTIAPHDGQRARRSTSTRRAIQSTRSPSTGWAEAWPGGSATDADLLTLRW